MKRRKDSEPSRAPGTRPPEYVIVIAASDWARSTTRTADSASGTPCTPAKTLNPNPGPTLNPTWKPNHDRDHHRHRDDQ